MNLDLTGKTALVTGSTAGIGRATALGLAQQGASVVVNGRTEERVRVAIAAIWEAVPAAKLQGVAADASTIEGAAQVFAAVPEIDVLVNNVGGTGGVTKSFDELDEADWQRVWDINVMSGVRFTRHYLPGMRKRDWGRVVFVSSESAIQIPAEFVHYGAVKAAEIALARGIAEGLTGGGITVNSVLPGPTLAERNTQRLKESGVPLEEFSRTYVIERRPTSLLKRLTSVDEVAAMIVYLCTPAASGTHGAALRVDGGVVKSAF